MTGHTEDAFDGFTNQGENDIFLTKYDSSGTHQWMIQIGTSSNDNAYGVAVDSLGNMYVTGHTEGAFDEFINQGENDIFLTKYNSSGDQQWMTQIGTYDYDKAYGVAVDSSGNAYVTGFTFGDLGGANAGESDVFLLKYDTDGNLQ